MRRSRMSLAQVKGLCQLLTVIGSLYKDWSQDLHFMVKEATLELLVQADLTSAAFISL